MKNLNFNPAQGPDWFMSLQVREGGQEVARFSVPLSPNELATLRILAQVRPCRLVVDAPEPVLLCQHRQDPQVHQEDARLHCNSLGSM